MTNKVKKVYAFAFVAVTLLRCGVFFFYFVRICIFCVQIFFDLSLSIDLFFFLFKELLLLSYVVFFHPLTNSLPISTFIDLFMAAVIDGSLQSLEFSEAIKDSPAFRYPYIFVFHYYLYMF